METGYYGHIERWHPIRCGKFMKSSANDDEFSRKKGLEAHSPSTRKQQTGPAKTRMVGLHTEGLSSQVQSFN